MNVKIKDFSVDMEVKNNGIEFEVKRTDGSHLGDCYVTKKGLIWCPGRIQRKNGHEITWEEFSKIFDK